MTQESNLQKLKAVLGDIDITANENKTLEWMSTWEESSVINLCNVIAKAKLVGFTNGIFAKTENVNGDGVSAEIAVQGNKVLIEKAFVGIVTSLHKGIFTTDEILMLILEGLLSNG